MVNAIVSVGFILGIILTMAGIANAREYVGYKNERFILPLRIFWKNMHKKFNEVGCWVTTFILFLFLGLGFISIYAPYSIFCLWMKIFGKKRPEGCNTWLYK